MRPGRLACSCHACCGGKVLASVQRDAVTAAYRLLIQAQESALLYSPALSTTGEGLLQLARVAE